MLNSSQGAEEAVFPTTGWENNITVIPRVSEESLLRYYTSRPGTEHNCDVDPFVLASTIRSNISQMSDGLVFVKASCYQSGEGESTYPVFAAITSEGEISSGSCECVNGQSACNHLMGALKTVALLQSKGFAKVPQNLRCTNLREEELVDDFMHQMKKLHRHRHQFKTRRQSIKEQDKSREHFRKALLEAAPDSLMARYMLKPPLSYVMTKSGPAPVGSPATYQKALLCYHFTRALGDP
ncbi:hypothetical protein MTO96_048560 [Rhipicephalus appendiculatus]|uniref:SWIM-type domain-containing protein n=1 Tax=Rhipicephalus appendiculatus TaxID=34631 RepID=A0A131YEH2_RHIAP